MLVVKIVVIALSSPSSVSVFGIFLVEKSFLRNGDKKDITIHHRGQVLSVGPSKIKIKVKEVILLLAEVI